MAPTRWLVQLMVVDPSGRVSSGGYLLGMRPPEEQTNLVTGSTDGRGKGLARELAKRRATALVHGRSQERLDAAVAEIAEASGNDRLVPWLADLSSPAVVRRPARTQVAPTPRRPTGETSPQDVPATRVPNDRKVLAEWSSSHRQWPGGWKAQRNSQISMFSPFPKVCSPPTDLGEGSDVVAVSWSAQAS